MHARFLAETTFDSETKSLFSNKHTLCPISKHSNGSEIHSACESEQIISQSENLMHSF